MLELQEKPDCFLKKSEYKKEKREEIGHPVRCYPSQGNGCGSSGGQSGSGSESSRHAIIDHRDYIKQTLVSLLWGNILARIATV